MPDEERQNHALWAANLAITGSRRREASRFASIELRASDSNHSLWETAALLSVACTAAAFVLGVWFL